MFLEDAVQLIERCGIAETLPHVALAGDRAQRLGASVAADHDRYLLLNGGRRVPEILKVVVTAGGQFVTLLDSREIVDFLNEIGHPDLVNGGRP